MLKAILFDLDGTLLPMDQDAFLGDYFKRLTTYMVPHGYEPARFGKAIWKCTGAMIANDGGATNETRFWEAFAALYAGERDVYADFPLFDAFYRDEFGKVEAVCGKNPESARLVNDLRTRGLTVALATNPVFPAVATEHRITWAGLTPSDFAYYTTYENATYAKPHPGYYREVADKLGLRPEECLMVGNDVSDDMVAATIGMQVFLLTDCLINKTGAPIDAYPHGDLTALRAHIETLL